MYKLEVFFDYICPFCFKGHEFLKELLPLYPQVEIIWHPCEAHPRPERGPHSDLCIQGMYYALSKDADLWAYHDTMYRIAQDGSTDIESIDALADAVSELLDADAFRASLKSGEYVKALNDGNNYAYKRSGVWVVPSYRMFAEKIYDLQGPRKFDSKEGVGVSKKQLETFLSPAKDA